MHRLLIGLFALSCWQSAAASRCKRNPYGSAVSTTPLRRGRHNPPSSYHPKKHIIGETSLTEAFGGTAYYVDVTIGSQTFKLVLDTGSSDTWVALNGYTCVDGSTNATLPDSDCGFDATFTPGPTFQQIPHENFNITYGDGSYVTGILGTDDVTVAGVKVRDQEVGLASVAAFTTGNVSAGIFGLAYPFLTSAYNVSNPAQDDYPKNHLFYSPFIHTAFFEQNLTEPLFSVALARNNAKEGPGGTFAIGGIPELWEPHINASECFVETPIVPVNITDTGSHVPTLLYYRIDVDNAIYGATTQTSVGSKTTYTVDTGTFLNYIPGPDAATLNAQFDPPATVNGGYYFVNCDAKMPYMAFNIAGRQFPMNPQDLVYDTGAGNNTCLSGIQDGSTAGAYPPFILGDVFLKNVLAVFDVGKGMVGLSSREYYE